MRISEVRILKVDKEDSKLKALASVTFDNCFVVHDIKIIDGTEGLFVAMPSRKTKEGEYKDIAHPINPDTRKLLSETILQTYNDNKD